MEDGTLKTLFCGRAKNLHITAVKSVITVFVFAQMLIMKHEWHHSHRFLRSSYRSALSSRRKNRSMHCSVQLQIVLNSKTARRLPPRRLKICPLL